MPERPNDLNSIESGNKKSKLLKIVRNTVLAVLGIAALGGGFVAYDDTKAQQEYENRYDALKDRNRFPPSQKVLSPKDTYEKIPHRNEGKIDTEENNKPADKEEKKDNQPKDRNPSRGRDNSRGYIEVNYA